MQSISENDFECLASTGVNTPGTTFPGRVQKTVGFAQAGPGKFSLSMLNFRLARNPLGSRQFRKDSPTGMLKSQSEAYKPPCTIVT
jgi:hypothetical protein